jgi:uncharacterized membrane protein YfcA
MIGSFCGARLSLMVQEDVMRQVLLIVLPVAAFFVLNPHLFPDRETLWRAISNVNRTVSAWQQIGEIVMRTEPFEKTATQKIKRYERRKEQP